jgi:hypothetical protein
MDYLVPFNPSLWMRAWLDESSAPKEFFSNKFKVWAKATLWNRFGISREDITHSSCLAIYKYLVSFEGEAQQFL